VIEDHKRKLTINNLNVRQHKEKAEKLRPNFGSLSTKHIMHTLVVATQFHCASSRLPLWKHLKTRFPAANVNCLNETVATETFFANAPAHDDGIMDHGGRTMSQLHVGKTSQHAEGISMQSESQMPGTLEDFTHKVGTPKLQCPVQ
jgi:hypothetical protein